MSTPCYTRCLHGQCRHRHQFFLSLYCCCFLSALQGLRLSLEERRDIGVDGLQPHVVLTLQESVALAWRILESKSTDFEKYIYLQSLSQTDTDTYYALILDHTKKIMPCQSLFRPLLPCSLPHHNTARVSKDGGLSCVWSKDGRGSLWGEETSFFFPGWQ